MLENLKKTNPAIVNDTVPAVVSVNELQKVLCRLLQEDVPIRDLETILETLGDYGQKIKDTDMLTEYVRQALKRAISARYFALNDTNSVVTLDPKIEQEIMAGVKQTENGSFINIDPSRTHEILESVGREVQKRENLGKNPIIVTSPIVRIYFRKLTEDYYKDLIVVSYNEVDSSVNLTSVGMVTA